MKMEGWDWLDDLISGGTTANSEEDDAGAAIKPRDKHIRDLIGGRPICLPLCAGAGSGCAWVGRATPVCRGRPEPCNDAYPGRLPGGRDADED